MPTLEHLDGFEFGLLTTSAHVGAAKLYDTVANAQITGSVFLHGLYSLRISPTGSARGWVTKNIAAGHRKLVTSFAVRIGASLPSTDVKIARLVNVSRTAELAYVASAGKLGIRWGSGAYTTFGQTIAPDAWYHVDWKADSSTTTFTQTIRVEGSTDLVLTIGGMAPGDFTSISLGTDSLTGPAATLYYEDYAFGFDTSEYPYGPLRMEALRPNADGTHNAGTNVIEDQGGLDIGTVPAYSLLNETSPDTTTYVQQSAVGASNYAEVRFPTPIDTTDIYAVEAFQASFAAGGTANSATSRIVDGSGATVVDIFSGDMSDGALLCATSKTLPTPVGGWTQASVAALRARIGFGTVIPSGGQPRWTAVMLQYATTATGPVHFPDSSADGVSTGDGRLSVARGMKGQATIVAGGGYVDAYSDDYVGEIAASLGLAFDIAGQSDATSDATANLSRDINLAGQADGSASATGNFPGERRLTGVADGSSITFGGLSIDIVLVGQSDGTSAGVGIIGRQVLLIGEATGTSATLGRLRGGVRRPWSFPLVGETDRPEPWDATTRPVSFDRSTRQTRWFTTVFVREDRSVALTFVAYGPFTENEIPEALLIKVLRPLRMGGTQPLEIFDQSPPYTATVSIQPPSGPVESRTAEIVDPADLPVDYPDDFTDPEEGWVRVTWEDGDFPNDGTYSVQVTLDNGDVRLKSTDVWRPEVNVGPASEVGA